MLGFSLMKTNLEDQFSPYIKIYSMPKKKKFMLKIYF